MQCSMNSTRLCQKRPRLKLEPKEYTIVRTGVLEEDGWRCQECGSMEGLEIHHIKRRGQLGGDMMHNLITPLPMSRAAPVETTVLMGQRSGRRERW
jgi:hypothetical protein